MKLGFGRNKLEPRLGWTVLETPGDKRGTSIGVYGEEKAKVESLGAGYYALSR